MKTCREIHDQASELLAGELSRRERLGVRVHLMMCRHCRRFLRHLELLAGSLRHHARTAVAPPGLVDRIIAARQADPILAAGGPGAAVPPGRAEDSLENPQ